MNIIAPIPETLKIHSIAIDIKLTSAKDNVAEKIISL
jgi:hypothetical protein